MLTNHNNVKLKDNTYINQESNRAQIHTHTHTLV